ncbi:MAG: RHS repeat-associated core domain-containing protein [Candidatus Acidiferrales bacterium]
MKRLVLLFCFVLSASVAGAQTGNGFPTFGSFANNGVDSVNLQNLNTVVTIPIVSSPGRGIPINVNVPYNALVWSYNPTSSSKAWTISGGFSQFSDNPTLVSLIGSATYQILTIPCGATHYSLYTDYVYLDPVGTSHPFSVTPGHSGTCSVPAELTGYATDGSGFYMNITGGATNPVVYTPSGMKIQDFTATDSNGNQLSGITNLNNFNEFDWTDTLGQLAVKVIASTTSMNVEYLDTSGNYQSVTFTLTPLSIATKFQCSGITEYTGTVTLPTAATLPNGQRYSFQYEHTPGSTTTYTGRLQKITLPTGGTVTYEFTGSNDGIDCTSGDILNFTRTVYDGSTNQTWTYARALNTPVLGETQTTVTSPKMPYDSAANQSVFVFSGTGQQLSAKLYQGSATGTPLRTTNMTWNANGTPMTATTILENGSTQNEVETTFDSSQPSGYSNGNLLTVKEHDWGSGAPGTVLRTTNYIYLTGNSPSGTAYAAVNLIHNVVTKTVADSTGTVHDRIDTAYDQGGTFSGSNCITNAPSHDNTDYPCSDLTRADPTSVTTYTTASNKTGGVTKTFTYDSVGNLRTAQVDCCQKKQWSYSTTAKYAYPDSVTDGPAGGTQLTTDFTYYLTTGQLDTATDANNQVTSMVYNDALRRITKVTRPDTTQVTYAYNDSGRTVSVTSPTQGTSTLVQITAFDELGRVSTATTSDGTNVYSIVETEYDPLSRPYMTSNPYTSSAQYWTTTQFDAAGRPTKVIAQDSTATTYAYATNTTTITDSDGKQKESYTDGLGRMNAVWEPGNGGGSPCTTTYSFNVFDSLTKTAETGCQIFLANAPSRSFAYDDMDRLTSQTTPEGGTVSFQYNSFDLTTQSTDARGVVKNYSYDTINRLVGVNYTIPVGSAVSAMPNVCTTSTGVSSNVCWTYDQGGASADALGRLTSMVDPTGSATYTYDPHMGRIMSIQKVVGTTTYDLSYAYNLAGEVVSITYPSSHAVQYSYDAIGRLCEVTGGTPSSQCGTATSPYATGIQYNAAFEATGFSYGNGVAASYGYSPDRLQLTSMSYVKSSQTLFGLNYYYKQDSTNCPSAPTGNDGQIQCIADLVDSGRSVAYSYDQLARLSTAATKGSTNYPAWGLSWTYDAFGNRTNQTVTAGTAPASSLTISTKTNQISGYTYDASGNMTIEPLSPPNDYTYDGESRLTAFSGDGGTGAYSYDGNGSRVVKASGGTTTVYIYSGSQVIDEYANGAAPSSPTSEYVYMGSQKVVLIQGSAAQYYLNDHLSIRGSTDSSGNVAEQRGHYPFGEFWYDTGSGATWIFNSYERDPESGNDYALARYDVSRIGRFASPDPISGNPADPQSLNRYPFAENDPIDLGDPSGEAVYPLDYPFGVGNGFNIGSTWSEFAFIGPVAVLYDFYGSSNFHFEDYSTEELLNYSQQGEISLISATTIDSNTLLDFDNFSNVRIDPRVVNAKKEAKNRATASLNCRQFIQKLLALLAGGKSGQGPNSADALANQIAHEQVAESNQEPSTQATARTDPTTYNVTLYPNAFASNNDLAVTLLHEAFHVGLGGFSDIEIASALFPGVHFNSDPTASAWWDQPLQVNCGLGKK